MLGRIAHVITESEPFGGAQRNTLLTLKGLVQGGYDVELVCGPGGRLVPEAAALGVEVHVLDDLVRPVRPATDARALVRLWSLFRARDYRIVHTHSTKAGVLGRAAARWARVPVVVHTLHGVPFEIDAGARSRAYLALERLLGRGTDRLVCVGEVLRQEAASWKMVPEAKLSTIYSGIDFPSYAVGGVDREKKRALGLESAWPILGCVGRLSEQKAQDFLVEAVARLRPRHPRVQLLLIGEGELRPALEAKIRDLGLADSVRLLGDRDDVSALLGIVDLYAMSSRWEGVGRALTEAMYFAKPIVATGVNGVRELIIHEETGLLVPPKDALALAAAIDRLASDRELAARLGAAAKRRAEELMDGAAMVAAIERLYADLVRDKKLGSVPARETPKRMLRGAGG